MISTIQPSDWDTTIVETVPDGIFQPTEALALIRHVQGSIEEAEFSNGIEENITEGATNEKRGWSQKQCSRNWTIVSIVGLLHTTQTKRTNENFDSPEGNELFIHLTGCTTNASMLLIQATE